MSDSLNIDRPGASPAGEGSGAQAPEAADRAPAQAAAPAEPGSLTLTPPEPVAPVAPAQAEQAVKLDPATVAKLDELVAGYLDAIAKLDVHDPSFATRVDDIRKLGNDEMQASAAVSSRLLDKPVAAMKSGGLSDNSTVANGLIQLRRTVEDLDPARQGDLLSPRRLLGILPFGDRLRNYFDRYTSSQSHINAIMKALYDGQRELDRDNVSIEQEKAALWHVMERLRQYIYLAEKLDSALAARISSIEATDPERANVLREDMLFYVRQKVQDLTTQLAVSVQGYLALDVIRKNNLELVKGVDRATTTTISALRTAVIVAQALADQKLVLDQITALNSTTSSIIESTSAMLRQQSAAVNEQAASSTIELQKLQNAFNNIYATMDEIDAFKLKALDGMAKTIEALSGEVGKAQRYLDRAHSQDQTGALPDSGGLPRLPD